MLNREADIGAAKHSIYERVQWGDPRVNRELVILAESPWVPENGLCVRKDLDPSLQSKLKDALLNLHMEAEGRAVLEQFGAVKFVETTVKDYQPVVELVREAGIDLLTYNYQDR